MQLLSHMDMLNLPTRFPGADARVIERANVLVKKARAYIRRNPNAEFAEIELPSSTYTNNRTKGAYPYLVIYNIEEAARRYYEAAGVVDMEIWAPLKEWKQSDSFPRLFGIHPHSASFLYAGFPNVGDALVAKTRVGEEHPWDQWGINLR